MSDLPLQGVRIIDLTHSWAGPHATRILADFGSEVIRVEYASRMCMFRGGKIENKAYNKFPAWHQINRNKYSITLDLKTGRDKKVLKDLVKISDVFVENARTGVMNNLGFGYADLIKIKSDIIMLSMAAFGNSGPYATYAGYGATVESLSGIQKLTAYADTKRPYRIRELDVINGVSAAGAIMTALLHHQKTGQGQHIDFSQMEAPTHALIGEHLLEYAMNGFRSGQLGNRHFKFAPQGCYQCKGTDKWVTLTIRSDGEWHRFCEALNHPEWKEDRRFATRSARIKNHDQLDRMIEKWTIRHSHIEAMQILQKRGIPSGAVLDAAEICRNPHLRHRQYFLGGVKDSDKEFVGLPFKLTNGGGRISWPGPDLGQHNQYVLCKLLGRSKNEVHPIKVSELGTAFDED
jgi:crotonobetainyl-CoA:carnitine CoA-transferase CaiB-like acyl-CoA transferase